MYIFPSIYWLLFVFHFFVSTLRELGMNLYVDHLERRERISVSGIDLKPLYLTKASCSHSADIIVKGDGQVMG